MSVSEPGKIITPWAESGLKNPIPPAANPATGRAGFDQGFSAINMTAKEAGGIPPFGQDFNGIFYEVTNILRYMQAGGQPTFSSALAAAIGGYPEGSVVLGSDGVTLWQSKVDSNSVDPNVNPSTWGAVDVGLRGEIASPSGAFKIGYGNGTVGGELDRISNSTLNALTSSNEVSRAWMNGLKGTAVLGDSISHGAFAGNLYSNGIMRLLARALNGEHNSDSYGFIPISAMGIGQPYETRDIQSSTLTGFSAREADLGTEYLPGIAYRSTALGSKITMVMPSFQRRCIVHHANQPGGGSFTVKVNGTLSATVDTSISSDKSAATWVNINDAGFGLSTIEIETTNALPVDILGFSYVSVTSQHVLQNMSQSGRRARWLSTAVIDSACKDSNTLIFALGYNDHQETDPAYISAVTAHIDTLIAKANQYGTDIVVPDFIWTAPPSNWMRVQLKRLADETGGVYIPFADSLLQPNGHNATASYLVDTLGMWVDGAHPNVYGCAWIFETIAKAMKLSCTSKRQALEQFDWWMSLKLSATIIRNASTTTPSSVKRTPSGLALRFLVTNSGGGVIPQGTYDVTTAYPGLTDLGGSITNTTPLLEDSAYPAVGSIRVSAGGAIRIRVTATPTVPNLSSVIVA